MFEGGMQFTGNCWHGRYPIILILEKRFNPSKYVVVNCHDIVSSCWYLITCFLLCMEAFQDHPTLGQRWRIRGGRSERIADWVLFVWDSHLRGWFWVQTEPTSFTPFNSHWENERRKDYQPIECQCISCFDVPFAASQSTFSPLLGAGSFRLRVEILEF